MYLYLMVMDVTIVPISRQRETQIQLSHEDILCLSSVVAEQIRASDSSSGGSSGFGFESRS